RDPLVTGVQTCALPISSSSGSSSGLIAVRTSREQLGSAEALEDLIGPPAAYLNLADQAPPDPELDPEDDATILYTSGTTGRPKRSEERRVGELGNSNSW